MTRLILAAMLALALGAPDALAQSVGASRNCDNSVAYDASTNGKTQLVALSTSRKIYVCSVAIQIGGTATNVSLVYGTGSACATGETALTPAFQLLANTGLVLSGAVWNGVAAPAGKALCIKTSAGNAVQALVTYSQPVN